MKKIANFLVEKRIIVLVFVLLITFGSAIMSQKVEVITDMTKYLPDDSSVKLGMDIMEEQFPDLETTNTIRIMFQDVPDENKETLMNSLEEITYVETVDYEADNELFNKDGHSLYVLNIPYDYGTEEMSLVESTLTSEFTGIYNMVYSVDSTTGSELPAWIVGLALLIMMIILFLMCNSWVEPFLYLVTIGMAIVINMGTNLFLGSVSETTSSIASILLLVLSMDYSIILTNRYRQELEKEKNKKEAMKKALTSAFSSITSSSLTTIVGLLMLIFMSFKIGADLGIVLAKGVLVSLLCVLTVLPAWLLIFDKWIQKTEKKVLHIPMNKLGKFSYKYRYIILVIFVLFFAGMFYEKGNTKIEFTMEMENELNDIFPKSNSVVVLYENEDEKVINDMIPELEEREGVTDVIAYGNTLGRSYTSEEMVNTISMLGGDISLDISMINLIYYEYFSDGEIDKIKLSDFLQFLQEGLITSEMFSERIDDNSKKQIEMLKPFSSKDELQAERSSTELSELFGIDSYILEQIFLMTGRESMSIMDLMGMMSADPTSLASMNMDEASMAKLEMIQYIISGVMSDQAYNTQEMAGLFGGADGLFDENSLKLIYTLYESEKQTDETRRMTIPEILTFLAGNMAFDEMYSDFLSEDMIGKMNEAKSELEENTRQLKGEEYSMLIVSTSLPDESSQTEQFIDYLLAETGEKIPGQVYLIGNSPMAYEMEKTFDSEFNKITILTAIAIFVVVLITFKNALIPAILVMLIQGAVYVTMVIMNLSGSGVYYLALLIVQSILMGATIDYAILYTSYYREKRQTMGIKEAVIAAYNGSVHTIMTSGMIMTLVTFVVGYAFEDETVRQIVHTISKGAACAIVLILFVLPGVLATCDRFVCKKRNAK